MLPDALANQDANRLPYFVTNAQTGVRQRVYFAPLLPEDEAQLRGPDWSRALYRDVWPAFAGDPYTLKMLCEAEQSDQIYGLVRIGRVTTPSGNLRKNLLESAPSNRFMSPTQTFRGVGQVLVARLVVQSHIEGGNGKLLVAPHPRSVLFYRKLGFRRNNHSDELTLDAISASLLLDSVMR